MSSLDLSTTHITFEPNDKFGQLKLTNSTKIQGIGRPLMFKVKTNKIDCVDAKPSCGYISGKEGHNEINISIRSLNNTKQYSAKLQILYVANDRITEEMVERNQHHFDINEYNENYEAIKVEAQTDVKTKILSVNRKAADLPQSAPIDSQPSHNESTKHNPSSISNTINVKSVPFTAKSQVKTVSNQPTVVSLKTLLLFVIAAFLVGILAGYSLGKTSQNQNNSVNAVSEEVHQNHDNVAETEIQQSVSNPQVINEPHDSSENTQTTQQNDQANQNPSDLNEFTEQQPTVSSPSQSIVQTEQTEDSFIQQPTIPTKQEILANTVQQTL